MSKTDEQGNITGAEYVGYDKGGKPKEGSVPAVAYEKDNILWVAPRAKS